MPSNKTHSPINAAPKTEKRKFPKNCVGITSDAISADSFGRAFTWYPYHLMSASEYGEDLFYQNSWTLYPPPFLPLFLSCFGSSGK